VESVSVYTMKYAEIFKCQNNISINGDIMKRPDNHLSNSLLLIRISVISFAAKPYIKVAVSSGMTSDQDVLWPQISTAYVI